MSQTINFGMNNFQNVNNNINQINNANRFTNLMINQYNQSNSMMTPMTNYNHENPQLNQMNTFNPNNPMTNQITNYNHENPQLNQMNTFNPNNQNLSQMNTFNQSNTMLNTMTNYNQGIPLLNQMNAILNQMNTMLNQLNNMKNQMNTILNNMNTMLNQMNSYDQSNQMLNMDIILMNQMMNKINEENKEMNQILNQMNEINQERSKEEMIQNINLHYLNKNKMELINLIIEFYKENGNEYMNFDNPNQIKNMIYFLSLNYHKLDKSDNIEDPLYYIEEPKKMIKFINSNYEEYKVKIPISITKYDLYSIAQKYKCFKNNNKHYTSDHSNILLMHNNLILNRDETSIEFINENDIIIIIEPRNFPDDSYYKSLQERTKKKENIKFEFSGKVINRIFPDDIKIYEIYKSYNLEFGLDIYTYKLLFNGLPLNISDQRKGSFLFGNLIVIFDHNILKKKFIFGKMVMVKIKYNKKREISESIGILNSIKNLKDLILISLGEKKIKKLKIENNEIEEGDIRSLYSLGIKNDFTCSIEYEE